MIENDKKSVKANEAMVRQRFAELDKGNFGILDDLFDPKYLLYFPGVPQPMDLATTRRFYKALYAAFPDLKHHIAEQISDRDRVVTRWTAQGTHRGEWMGVAPTGKEITLTGINIYRVTQGRLSQSHVSWDMLGLLQQLGAVNPQMEIAKASGK